MKRKKTPKLDLETIFPLLIAQWRKLQEIPGPADVLQTREFRSVVEAVKKLQRGLHVDRSLAGTDYFKSKELLGGYLLYDWLIHYQEGYALLGELPRPPRRVLDVCSGPLPMAFAALHHSAEEVIATDKNLGALLLGAEVCGRYGYPVTTRRWDSLSQQAPPFEGLFDLIIVSHCLEELFPSTKKGWVEEQEQFIKRIMNYLTPDGHLLIVESSYQETNRRILELRDRMVSSGIPIQAPCVWRGKCPAIQKEYQPCYAQREMEKTYHLKEIQRAAQINLSSLKMSYLILRHPDASWPNIGDKKLYRVVSPEFETPQGRKFYLCGIDGKKTLESRVNKHPQESKCFDFLRRGELIKISNSVNSGSRMVIAEDTELSIEAALNKPFIEIESS